MKKSTKIWVSIAIISIIIGSLIFVTTMSILKWDIKKLSTSNFETNVYEFGEDVSNISINVITADVTFTVSTYNKTTVTCFEDEKAKHSVTVENGTLLIKENDERSLFDKFGVNFTSPKITVSLPEVELNQIVIETTTADVCLQDISASTLNIKTTTGEICVKNSSFSGEVKVVVTTGDIELNSVYGGKIDLKSTTGDVELDYVDGGEIYIKTTTGDVSGSILTDKKFIANTTTGDVEVPRNTDGGICQVKTTTGDIELRIKRP